MFNIVYVRVVFLALSLSLLNACSMNSGDYGPFTLVIESEDGKQVEDIIVNLSYIHTGGHSKSSSYSQTQVVSTGEAITFPRGYVSSTNDSAIGMYVGISHLDYQQISLQMVDINTEKKDQVIDLGKAMIRFKEISEKRISRYMKSEEVNRKQAIFLIKKSNLYSISNKYFVSAMRIGREDLIEKYLALKLSEIYKKDNAISEKKSFENELRDNVEYYRSYGR